jgi:hypothetical protein
MFNVQCVSLHNCVICYPKMKLQNYFYTTTLFLYLFEKKMNLQIIRIQRSLHYCTCHQDSSGDDILCFSPPSKVIHFLFLLLFYFLLFIHLFICAYFVWAMSSPCSLTPSSSPTLLTSRQNFFCSLLQFC